MSDETIAMMCVWIGLIGFTCFIVMLVSVVSLYDRIGVTDKKGK